MISKPEDLISLGIIIALVLRFYLLIALLNSIQERKTRTALDRIKARAGPLPLLPDFATELASLFGESANAIGYAWLYTAPGFEMALLRITTGSGRRRGIRQYILIRASQTFADFAWTGALKRNDYSDVDSANVNHILGLRRMQVRSQGKWLMIRGGTFDASTPAGSRLSIPARAA